MKTIITALLLMLGMVTNVAAAENSLTYIQCTTEKILGGTKLFDSSLIGYNHIWIIDDKNKIMLTMEKYKAWEETMVFNNNKIKINTSIAQTRLTGVFEILILNRFTGAFSLSKEYFNKYHPDFEKELNTKPMMDSFDPITGELLKKNSRNYPILHQKGHCKKIDSKPKL